MIRHAALYVILAALALMAGGCRRDAKPEPNKWPRVNNDFDRLTELAESYLF